MSMIEAELAQRRAIADVAARMLGVENVTSRGIKSDVENAGQLSEIMAFPVDGTGWTDLTDGEGNVLYLLDYHPLDSR